MKLATMKFEKITSIKNGNIETHSVMLNQKVHEFYQIIEDMIDQSTASYKEEPQININSSIAFNQNFIVTINFALAAYQVLPFPLMTQEITI
jgi:hypothetical protein